MNVDFTSKVAIIYPTKDDFVEKAFEKLLNINYKNADIYILDDSVEKGYKDKIDKFNNRCTILRRWEEKDYHGSKNKAGNINYFLQKKFDFDFLIILDADSYIEKDFVENCLKYFHTFNDIGILQAIEKPVEIKNLFQSFINTSHSSDVFYNGISYFSSNIFGQPLFYGHIAMIKRNTLEECGFSFPNLVGEDHAFSLEAIFKGYKICYAPNIICGCEEPPNLIAQRTKIIKFVGGDYEVMKKYWGKILKTDKLSFIKKIEFLSQKFMVSVFPLITLIFTFFLFGSRFFGSRYLYHFYSNFFELNTNLNFLNLLLGVFILFSGFLYFILIPLFQSINLKTFFLGILSNMFLLLVTCSYIFLLAWRCIKCIFGAKAKFCRTPKEQTKISFVEALKLNLSIVLTSLILLIIYVFLMIFSKIFFFDFFISFIIFAGLLSPFITILSNVILPEKTKK